MLVERPIKNSGSKLNNIKKTEEVLMSSIEEKKINNVEYIITLAFFISSDSINH